MKNFKQLFVWQKGMEIWKSTYRLCKNLPKEERYGLISQMQRASSSIPANIAEGSARESKKDHHRYLRVALGSAFELETFIIGISDMQMVNQEEAYALLALIDEEQKMLMSYMKKINP